MTTKLKVKYYLTKLWREFKESIKTHWYVYIACIMLPISIKETYLGNKLGLIGLCIWFFGLGVTLLLEQINHMQTKYLKNLYKVKHNKLIDEYNKLINENIEIIKNYKEFYISVIGKEEYEKQLKEFEEKNNIKGDKDESI